MKIRTSGVRSNLPFGSAGYSAAKLIAGIHAKAANSASFLDTVGFRHDRAEFLGALGAKGRDFQWPSGAIGVRERTERKKYAFQNRPSAAPP